MTWLLLTLCSVLPLCASLFYFLPQESLPGFGWIMGAAKAFTFLAPFLLWKQLGIPGSWKSFPDHLSFAGDRAGRLLRGIFLGLLMGALIYVAWMFLPPAMHEQGLARIREKIHDLHLEDNFVFYVIGLSLLHSALEEFYWRFFLYRAWKKKVPGLAAHFIAGLAFALHHFVVTVHYFDFALGLLLGAGVIVGGAIWSAFYEHERSLAPVWISHVVVDVILMTIGIQALTHS